MDTEVLRQKLREQFDIRLTEALSAVQSAADGQWISHSLAAIREILCKLMILLNINRMGSRIKHFAN